MTPATLARLSRLYEAEARQAERPSERRRLEGLGARAERMARTMKHTSQTTQVLGPVGPPSTWLRRIEQAPGALRACLDNWLDYPSQRTPANWYNLELSAWIVDVEVPALRAAMSHPTAYSYPRFEPSRAWDARVRSLLSQRAAERGTNKGANVTDSAGGTTMQIRILVLLASPQGWQQLGPIEIPAYLAGAYGGSEQLVDAMFDAWIVQVRAQYPGVRILSSADNEDWKEW